MNELMARAYLENAIERANTRNTARRAAQDLKLRAARTRDGAGNFIADHPFVAVAGGIAVGLLIGSLLPGRKLGPAARALAAMATRAGMDYGRQALKNALYARQSHADGDTEVTDEHTAAPMSSTDRLKHTLLGA